MPSLLESLAMGLRGAGGLLSPEVYKQNAQDDRQDQAIRQQLQMQQYQQRIKDERDRAIAQTVAPFIEKGDFRGAAGAVMNIPGGAPYAQKFLEQDLNNRKLDAQNNKPQRPVVVGKSAIDPVTGKVIFEAPDEPKPVAPSNIGKLIAERDALPEGDPRRNFYNQALANAGKGPNTTIVNQMPGALPPGTGVRNKVDEGLLESGMRLQRLARIESQFKPEYQMIPTRVLTEALSIGDKFGVNLSPENKKLLTDFSAYKRNAIDAMNEYIKSITGAAMSAEEARRILKGLPNPGQGLADGDSPTEFKSRLYDAIKATRMAEARLVYIKRNNSFALADPTAMEAEFSRIPLSRMPSLMNQRASELEKQARERDPKMKLPEIRALVKRNLAQEFGLVGD